MSFNARADFRRISRKGAAAVARILLFSASCMPSPAAAVTPPQLPLSWVDTTMPTQAGTTWHVPYTGNVLTDGNALQSALDAANYGDTVTIAAGGIFIDPNGGQGFQLKPKHANGASRTGTGWIVVRTDAPDSSLPPSGTRVDPSYAPVMPKITTVSAGLFSIFAQSNAHHWRLLGLEVYPQRTVNTGYDAIVLGDNTQTSLSNVPDHIIVDRCYIHGDATQGARRGVILNGSYVAVVDSYIQNIYMPGGFQATAVSGWQASGPIKIVNNYMEAAGSVVGFGGAVSGIANANPFDIEIRLNTMTIQEAWYSLNVDIRNLLEFKAAIRSLIEANIFTNMHTSAGGPGFYGTALTISAPPSPDDTWEAISDVTVRNNRFNHLGGGAAFGGTNGTAPITTRIAVVNNVWTDITAALGANGAGGSLFTLSNGVDQVTITHNTSTNEGSTSSSNLGIGFCVLSAQGIVWQNNIHPGGTYGNLGGGLAGCVGTAYGEAAVANYWPGQHIFDTNVHVGPWPTSGGVSPVTWYPAWYGSHPSWFTADLSGVGFANLTNCQSGSDYTGCALSSSSAFHNAATDGTDVGVNLTTLGAAFAQGDNAYSSGLAAPTSLLVY